MAFEVANGVQNPEWSLLGMDGRIGYFTDERLKAQKKGG